MSFVFTVVLPYLFLGFAAYAFSVFTWNRAALMGGTKFNERSGLMYAVATMLAVWSIKTLFQL